MSEKITQSEDNGKPTDSFEGFISAAGTILAVSYPVLALSTGVRAGYQLFFKEGVTDFVPPLLSLVAALCYLTATLGFAIRQRWAWRLSVGVLLFETAMTLVIGTLSLVSPDLVGRTVWRYFGADYGFLPFFQPLLGIAWLFHPRTIATYGISLSRDLLFRKG